MYKKYDTDPEHLLYDFDWVVGDTLPRNFDIYQGKLTVTHVDPVSMEDGTTRRFYTIYCEAEDANYYLVEGIGDIDAILYADAICSIQEGAYYNLLCFYTNNQLIYRSPIATDCMILGTNDEIAASIQIFPNPANEII